MNGFTSGGSWSKCLEGQIRVGGKIQTAPKALWEREALPPTAWGPGARLRAPGGVQGQRPGGGPGGEAPGSSAIFTKLRVLERSIWKSSHGI